MLPLPWIAGAALATYAVLGRPAFRWKKVAGTSLLQSTWQGKVVTKLVPKYAPAGVIFLKPVGRNPDGEMQYLERRAAAAFRKMQAAAWKQGVKLIPNSGWRGFAEQTLLYVRHCAPHAFIKCEPPTAPPGGSNHNNGESIDIVVPGNYAGPEWTWLKANAGKFGFVNDVAGEDWHWTFRG